MKQIVAGLVVVLFAGSAIAQTAPTQHARPHAQAQKAAQPAPVPTVPVQTAKGTHTTGIVLGAVGAVALIAAGSGGGGSKPAPTPPKKPSSP